MICTAKNTYRQARNTWSVIKIMRLLQLYTKKHLNNMINIWYTMQKIPTDRQVTRDRWSKSCVFNIFKERNLLLPSSNLVKMGAAVQKCLDKLSNKIARESFGALWSKGGQLWGQSPAYYGLLSNLSSDLHGSLFFDFGPMQCCLFTFK